MKKLKDMQNNFGKKIITDLKLTETTNNLTKIDLETHVGEYKSGMTQV
jgi:hypothetical protein